MEGIWGLPIAMILRGHSNSYCYQIIYLLHGDGDARLYCSIPCTLKLPLGWPLIFKGRTRWLKKLWINLNVASPRSFSSLIASSNMFR